MLDFYYAPTPNGQKVLLFLEETGLPHRIVKVRLGKGEQFAPAFLAISPNNKIPAIVDHAPADGGAPQSVFESGAILLYLAQKTQQLLPANERERLDVLQWLFWQVGGLGPMAGQAGYFRVYAPTAIAEAIERYTKEVSRLYGVLDRRLDGRDWIVGAAYSIADIAIYPWIVPHRGHGQDLAQFPHLQRWFDRIAARPATQRAYVGVEDTYSRPPDWSDEERHALFGTPAPR
jgi:GSH-dependent disulfide-bond oxidoreductase